MNRMTDRGWDCHYIANHFPSQTLKPPIKFEDGHELKFTIHGSGRAPYAQDIIEPLCRELKPDVFGVLLDTFMMMDNPPNWFLSKNFSPAKSCFYYPSDGGGCLPKRQGVDCSNVLRKVNVPIAMSKFAQKQAWELYKIKAKYIPHAIDTEMYHPVSFEDKQKLRAKWGFDSSYVYGGKEKFVVGSVFRNQGRKSPDRMYKAFAKFSKDVPEAMFYLHTDPTDIAQAWDTRMLLNDLGILHKTTFTGMTYYKGFNYTEMNDVYNMMDVFFLSTSGEGFGIPIIEAMACAVPTLITDYTTTRELTIQDGQCGEAVKLSGTSDEENPDVHTTQILDGTQTGSWHVERGIMSIPDAVEKLHKLHDNEGLRRRYGAVGRQKAVRDYDWDKVMPLWENCFEEML